MTQPSKTAPFTAQVLEGTVLRGGRYQLERKIAQGGMGSLYKGIHIQLQQPVAIKLIHPRLMDNQIFLQRFKEEARLQFCMRHTHIVQVTDIIEDTATGIVLEWIDGGDLKQYLDRHPVPVSLSLMWELFNPLLDAMAYLHAKGVVHRDIKPANVLLHRTESGWHPKLTDFGIAKDLAQQHNMTATGSTIGTSAYMPPEQFTDSKRVDQRADIYSLGVTLFHLLTGRLPFQKTGPDLLMQKVSEEPPMARSIRPDLPPAIDGILQRCMKQEPSDRYESCEALGAALRTLLEPMQMKGKCASTISFDLLSTDQFPAASSAIFNVDAEDDVPPSDEDAELATRLNYAHPSEAPQSSSPATMVFSPRKLDPFATRVDPDPLSPMPMLVLTPPHTLSNSNATPVLPTHQGDSGHPSLPSGAPVEAAQDPNNIPTLQSPMDAQPAIPPQASPIRGTWLAAIGALLFLTGLGVGLVLRTLLGK